ncbi:hypothetical protein HELRODRAFT_168024 [Helobdella robusta]|uniref:FLYWCH-type domain-containing protein n=1 Tax=Helobdella robusta TaxID=6412 RepID=T1F027_HELRO|nr:hypothetical protein HELRODRAFT_168024 [Helobdella robusta]ESO10155.1 hypothetical protein HELRODRAFT_168024 [Helobdella robusta]
MKVNFAVSGEKIAGQKTVKGLIVDAGYFFVKGKRRNDTISWKCSEYKKGKCPACRHTRLNEIVKSIGDHNHVPDCAKVKAKRVMVNGKTQIAEIIVSSHVIVANCTSHLSQAVDKNHIYNGLKRPLKNHSILDGVATRDCEPLD